MEKVDYKDMLLESASGFMMPYALSNKEELQVTLGYGEQTHPATGMKFNHKGVDLSAKDKDLYALATGVIIGAGRNAQHDNYIVAKYGNYEVTYGHVAEAYTPYGTTVRAGEKIAKSGDFLHFEVHLKDQVLDPMEFLGMIWGNIQQLAAMGIQKQPTIDEIGGHKFKTPYDAEQDDILMMMLRFLPTYFNDLRRGEYMPPRRFETSLRNIFMQGADRNYYFENMPNIANPLGLGERSIPLIEKVQKILLDDFLCYMALKNDMYPSSWDSEQKKNFLSKLPKTA